MHFLSEEFLAFSLVFALAFFLCGLTAQKILLVVAGLVFAGYHSPVFALVLSISILVNYAASRFVVPTGGRRFLFAGIAFNVLYLGVFKYFNFFVGAFSDGLWLLGLKFSPFFISIAFPLGISFYTLQAISYLVDLREERVGRASFLDLCVFLSFWPKFVAGPIIRGTELLPQLATPRRFRWANFYLGLESVIYGLFLKTVLADRLAPFVTKVYAAPAAHDSVQSLLAALFFTFQIYGDFAGYSLVVIGVSRILGFSVKANFLRPMFARSFTDFWSRWHISLSRWLRDYIFLRLPVGAHDATNEWHSVAQIYRELLNLPDVDDQQSFTTLAGDSLALVQISLALESYLGELPKGWETKSIAQLEELSPAKAVLVGGFA